MLAGLASFYRLYGSKHWDNPLLLLALDEHETYLVLYLCCPFCIFIFTYPLILVYYLSWWDITYHKQCLGSLVVSQSETETTGPGSLMCDSMDGISWTGRCWNLFRLWLSVCVWGGWGWGKHGAKVKLRFLKTWHLSYLQSLPPS